MTIARNVAVLRATLLGGALLLAAAVPAFADSPSTVPAITSTNAVSVLNAHQLLPAVQQPQSTNQPSPHPGQHPGGVGTPDIAVTDAGPTPDGFDRFTVGNIGTAPTETFHVAVIALANSYGFDIANLAPGQSKTYTLPFNDCQTGAVILANTGNTVKENNYSNDSLVLQGTCQVDGGSNLVPASN